MLPAGRSLTTTPTGWWRTQCDGCAQIRVGQRVLAGLPLLSLDGTHHRYHRSRGAAGCSGQGRSDGSAVRQQFAAVVEENHSIAQQAPPLFGVRGDYMGGLTAGRLGWGAGGLVLAHLGPPARGYFDLIGSHPERGA